MWNSLRALRVICVIAVMGVGGATAVGVDRISELPQLVIASDDTGWGLRNASADGNDTGWGSGGKSQTLATAQVADTGWGRA